MKYSFVVAINDPFLFGVNCTINAAKYFGTTADFNIIYDDDISQEKRDSYQNQFPFEIKWHRLQPLYDELLETAVTKPHRFWTTPWYLASKLLDEYDAICILQGDELLMSNVNALFKIAATTDIVIATEYHGAYEFDDLPFGDPKSIMLNNIGYTLYDQLVFCGRANRQIFIDTYKQQCTDTWLGHSAPRINDPLTALSQACTTHLSIDRVLGLNCHIWTWDKGAWPKYRLLYDKTRHLLYDREVRIRGLHSKWWLNTIVTSAIQREKEAGYHETAQIIAHNYNIQREIATAFNEMTPATKNDGYTKEIFNGD